MNSIDLGRCPFTVGAPATAEHAANWVANQAELHRLQEINIDLLAACEEFLEAKRTGVILSTDDKPNEHRARTMIAAAVKKARGI